MSQYVDRDTATSFIKKKHIGFIGVGFGISNPGSDFDDQQLQGFYNGSGFASIGYNLNINYYHLITQNFGFTLLLSHSSHGYNSQEIEDYNHIYHPSISYKIETGRYRTTGYLGGILVSFPLKNGFFDIRMLLGYSTSYAPAFHIESRDSVSVEYIDINSSTSHSLVSNFGVGVRLNITYSLALSFNLDYYNSNPEYHHTQTSNSGNPVLLNYSLRMSMMNSTIGLVYKIPSF